MVLRLGHSCDSHTVGSYVGRRMASVLLYNTTILRVQFDAEAIGVTRREMDVVELSHYSTVLRRSVGCHDGRETGASLIALEFGP